MDVLAGRKAALGALFWLLLATAITAAVRGLEPQTRRQIEHVKIEMWRALLDPAPTYTVWFTGGTFLERGNGVLAVVDGRLERVGEVVRVRAEGELLRDVRATIALDDRVGGFRPRAGCVGVRRSQGRSFLEAVRTLVPAERWERIQDEWREFRLRHDAALARELEPVAAALMATALQSIAEELPGAIERHRREIEAVAARLRVEIGREQVAPLIVEELWPLAAARFAAPVEAIGRELWQKAPLMSFALRAVADRVLEDEPVRVEERWRSFVAEEAVPTLKAHQRELEAALGAALRDAMASGKVQARVAALWDDVRGDREVKALVQALARELLLENPRLQEKLRAQLEVPATRARLLRVNDRLQDFLGPVGDMLLLDASGQGINPELAYLIRLLLLRRDAQVIHLEGGDGEPLEPGTELVGRHES